MGYIKRELAKACALGLLGFNLWACGSQQAPETSSVKVTNGRKALAQEFPSVVMLVMLTSQGQGICTGTFVNDSQVLTAGHCVEGLDNNNLMLFYAAEINGQLTPVARAQKFQRHPAYDIKLGVSPVDVSVITFPAGTAPAQSQIASTSPSKEDVLTIIGYGNNQNFKDTTGKQGGSGAGVKRIGTNKVAAVAGGFIQFLGVPAAMNQLPEGDLVSSGSGDSGGPLFVGGKLAGVTSGGGLAETTIGLLSSSLYVDLNSSLVQPFLAQALKPSTTR